MMNSAYEIDDLSGLMDILRSTISYERRSAAYKLGEAAANGIDISPVIAELLKQIGKEENALWAMQKAAQSEKCGETVLNALLKEITDGSSEVREPSIIVLAAATANKKIGKDAINALIRLMSSIEYRMRELAARALRDAANNKVDITSAIPELAKLLSDKIDVVKYSVIDALEAAARNKFNIATAVPHLMKLMSAGSCTDQNIIDKVIMAAAKNRMNIIAVLPDILKLLENDDNNSKRIATGFLKKAARNDKTDVLELLEKLAGKTKNNSLDIRKSFPAARRIVIAEMLTTPIKNRADFVRIIQLTKGFGYLDNKQKIMIANISRQAAANHICIREVIPVLVKMLDDQDDELRSAAVETIKVAAENRLDVSSAVPQLIKCLQYGRRFYKTAINILAETAKNEADFMGLIQGIRKAIISDNKQKIAIANISSGVCARGINIREVMPELLKMLDDQDDELRSAAVEAIKAAAENRLDVSSAVPQLIKCLQSGGKFYVTAINILTETARNGDTHTQLLLAEEVSKYVAGNQWFCAQRQKNSPEYVSVTKDIAKILSISVARLEAA